MLPWREENADGQRNPYHVWVSEVMLQQTRVETVIPYFERFIASFPTVEDLAHAPLDDVLKHWEGLGYYSRARNLHRAARRLMNEFDGEIPNSQEDILQLAGIGPYTAAAVLSLAFATPLAAVDGNVTRVLSRVFSLENDISRSSTRRTIQDLADALIPRDTPGRFNEALMELGATVCTPTEPACDACPLNGCCLAYSHGNQEGYPVRKRKTPVPNVEVAVGLLRDKNGCILLQKRPVDVMLGGMWEFPGGKQKNGESIEETCRRELREELDIDVDVGEQVATIDHTYSHLNVTLHAFWCRIASGTPRGAEGQPFRWVSMEEMNELAIPRASRKVLEALSGDEA